MSALTTTKSTSNSNSNANNNSNDQRPKGVSLDPIVLSGFGMSKVFKISNNNNNNNNNNESKSNSSDNSNNNNNNNSSHNHKKNFLGTTGLDIDSTGEYAIASSSDNYLRFYSCLEGKVKKTIQCSKYGVSCVKFTHHNKAIIEACNNTNANNKNNSNNKNGNNNNNNNSNALIRYHSIHDNTYIGCFNGHSDKITSLDMSRVDDTFMSAGLDRYVRLWDLRLSGHAISNNTNGNNNTIKTTPCVAQVKVNGRPTVCCDNEGLIFAVGTGNNEIKLYDKRDYQRGPFTSFRISDGAQGGGGGGGGGGGAQEHYGASPYGGSHSHNSGVPFEWCDLEFSPNGKYILVSTRTNKIYLIDSYDGRTITCYQSHNNKKNIDLHATFTSDGKYVTCGSTDGDIYFWETEKGKQVCIWAGHPNPVQYCKWNPQYLMAVTSAQNTVFWIPDWRKIETKRNQFKYNRKKSNLKKDINSINNNNNAQTSSNSNKTKNASTSLRSTTNKEKDSR